MLNNYRRSSSGENIDFELIHRLVSKIHTLRNDSFQEFPKMIHSEVLQPQTESVNLSRLLRDAKFRWATFMRNGSWFIVKFDSFRIIDYKDSVIFPDDNTRIAVNSENYTVNDLLSRFRAGGRKEPKYFLLVRNKDGVSCFAASKLGRRILADTDVISRLLVPFKKSSVHRGRVRIFGKNHIYL